MRVGVGDELQHLEEIMGSRCVSRQNSDSEESNDEIVAYRNFGNTAAAAPRINAHSGKVGHYVAPVIHASANRPPSNEPTSHRAKVVAHFEQYHANKELNPRVSSMVHSACIPLVSYSSSRHGIGKIDKKDGHTYKFANIGQSISGTMPWLSKRVKHIVLLKFLEYCLRGIGQVFFMNNPITGLFILAALLVQNATVACYGLIGLASSNLVAIFLGFDEGLLRSGLFGYNGVLVGVALTTFEPQDTWTWANMVAVLITAGLSSIIFVALGKLLVPYKVPPFTLPFNIATLMYLLATRTSGRLVNGAQTNAVLVGYTPAQSVSIPQTEQIFEAILKGVGQVYLADHTISGILMIIGISICSRITAVSVVVGSALGIATALATGADGAAIELGLYGYNASLTCGAVFGMFYVASFRVFVVAVAASMLTASMTDTLGTLLAPYGAKVYTLPFCVVSLLFVLIQGAATHMIAVPLSDITYPEEHFRRVKALRYMIKLFTGLLESQSRRSVQLEHMAEPASERHVAKTSVERLIAEAFANIDADSSGDIDIIELESILIANGLSDCPYPLVERLFELMDVDQSGAITLNDFLSFVKTMQRLQGIGAEMDSFFAFIDTDRSGTLDAKEIIGAQEVLQIRQLTHDDIHCLIQMVSTDTTRDHIYIEELVGSLVQALLPKDSTCGNNRS